MSEPSDNLIQDFAVHPDKWEKANKDHIAKQLGVNVEEIEARIAKAVASAPKLAVHAARGIPDMPIACLAPGKLGQICREVMLKNGFCLSYSWLPLLVAAGAHVKTDKKPHINIYFNVVGEAESGKSAGQAWANYLMGLDQRGMCNTESFGSAEGMIKAVGNQEGNPYVWSIDEMAHLFTKGNFKGASFFKVLNTLFYEKTYQTTGEKGVKQFINASLSISGGMTPTSFPDCYGADSLNGIYSRTMFAHQPTGFVFDYQGEPHELGVERIMKAPEVFGAGASGLLPSEKPLIAPLVNRELYKEKSILMKEEKINGRVLECCIRCARISAAWDGLTELKCDYMGPFWELARDQMRVRRLLRPNIGQSEDAKCTNDLITFVEEHAGTDWVTKRDVLQKTLAARKYGTPCVTRVWKSLVDTRTFDEAVKPTKGRPSIIVRMATFDE